MLVAVLAIPLSLFVIFREPKVQTITARYIAAYLSKKLTTDVSIERFFLGIDLSLHLNEIHIKDKQHNTLFYAGDMKLLVFPGDFSNRLDINTLSIDNFEANIVQYNSADDLNFQFIVDFFASSDTAPSTSSKVFPVSIQNISLSAGRFKYLLQYDTLDVQKEMDYNNLQLRDIYLKASGIDIIGDSISATIKQLRAKERSGISLENLKTQLTLNSEILQAKELKLLTPKSSLQADLEFRYNGFGAFLEFIDSVEIKAEVLPSSLYLADIGVFAPVMYEMPNMIAFSGNIEGTVADFKTGNMSFSFGEQTTFKGSLEMKGLPDFFNSDIKLNVTSFQTEANDIAAFRIPIEGGTIPLPDMVSQLGIIQLGGDFIGKYEDFTTNFRAATGLGKLVADLVFSTNPQTGHVHYDLKADVSKFNIGQIAGQNKLLGEMDANIVANGYGFELPNAAFDVDLMIKRLIMNGVAYSNIPVEAELSDQLITAELGVHEEILDMDVSSIIDFSESLPHFILNAAINHADLFGMNFIRTDTINQLNANIAADFYGVDEDKLSGTLKIDQLRYLKSDKQLIMDSFSCNLQDDALLERKLKINSDFLDFEMGGQFTLSAIPEAFIGYLAHYMGFEWLSAMIDPARPTPIQDFYFNLNLKNLSSLMPFLDPGLDIAPNSNFSGVYTQKSNVLHATFRSNWITYQGVLLDNPYLFLQSNNQKANVKIELADLIFKKSSAQDSIDFGLQSPKINVEVANDSAAFSLEWSNERTRMLNQGLLKGLFFLDSLNNGSLTFSQSDAIVNDSALRIKEGSRFYFDKEFTLIDNLEIQHGQSFLDVDGRLPFREQDSLIIQFKNYNISAFDIITGTAGFDLDGVLNGDLVVSNVVANPYFSSNLHILGLGLNNEKLGDARLISNWSNSSQSIYANVQIINTGNVSNSRMLNLRGFYYPGREKDNISFDLSLKNFKLKILNQFMVDIVSQLEGVASGEFTIGGELTKPVLQGNLQLSRTAFLIDYLNVKYSLQHEFNLEPGLIPVENLIMFDTAGRRAVINGRITHDHLTKWAFDISIKPEALLAMNTGPKQNELFYGSAIATGEVLIKGPLENIDMSIKAISEKGTSIVIPLNTAGSVGSSDFIRFTQKMDTASIDSLMNSSAIATNESIGFNINLNTEVTPDASVKIFLPYDMGSLEARGNGNIALGVNDAGSFTLNGDYFVQDGLFTFTFENLLKKRFNLQEGGRITWTGDPYEADLDVKGVYRVKASLAGLGIDTTSSLRNRINVDCIIHLTNGLFNPDIAFSFALPGSDPDIEQKVFSVIDTTNSALMTQHMVSLLVLGSFASTNLGNSSLTNSTFEMISGQLSGLLSQISKDFDIGLNYRPGDQLSNEELEVALSTQLFNERVSIEGNFGVSNNRNVSQSASNIVGDVDVNVKLNEDGSFRMKAFNHSNHSSWLNYGVFDNYSPYTQGVGVSYRQEFDAINEIFKKKKSTKQSKLKKGKQ